MVICVKDVKNPSSAAESRKIFEVSPELFYLYKKVDLKNSRIPMQYQKYLPIIL